MKPLDLPLEPNRSFVASSDGVPDPRAALSAIDLHAHQIYRRARNPRRHRRHAAPGVAMTFDTLFRALTRS